MSATLLRRTVLVAVLVSGVLCPTQVRADAVTDWNEIAVQAVFSNVPPRPGPSTLLDLAMVQAAVYDAVEAIDKRFKPYHVVIPGASGSPAAAAAKAAHDVLVNRLPGQAMSLDKTYHDYLSAHGLSEDDPGVEVGRKAAAGIIEFRANDNSFPNPPPPDYLGGKGAGDWRPTPPNFAPMAAPWLAAVKPFTLASPRQFRLGRQPALTSNQYLRAYNEVKALGALSNSERTPDQTDLAHFYDENFIMLLNRGLRDIAATHIDNIGDSARLFALANLSMADAAITAWDSKRHYVFWRPITAIQEGSTTGTRTPSATPLGSRWWVPRRILTTPREQTTSMPPQCVPSCSSSGQTA